jgi:hypothetical protein
MRPHERWSRRRGSEKFIWCFPTAQRCSPSHLLLKRSTSGITHLGTLLFSERTRCRGSSLEVDKAHLEGCARCGSKPRQCGCTPRARLWSLICPFYPQSGSSWCGAYTAANQQIIDAMTRAGSDQRCIWQPLSVNCGTPARRFERL